MTDPTRMERADGTELDSPKEKYHRLEVLVGELLAANERLRLQIIEMEQRVERAECGLSQAARWSGMLL